MSESLVTVDLLELPAGRMSAWLFVVVTTSDGRRGLGEATVPFEAEAVAAHVRVLFRTYVRGTLISDVDQAVAALASESAGGELAHAAAISSLEQAMLEITASSLAVSTSSLLGEERRRSARVYANINRNLGNRSPEGFAEAVRAAANLGYGAVKCAPFDGVIGSGDAEDARLLAIGLERIAAARSSLAESAELYVDCHGRLNRSQAVTVAEELASIGVTWFEEPLSTHPTMASVQHERDNPAARSGHMQELQSQHGDIMDRKYVTDCAHDLGLRIAGGEFLYGIDEFEAALGDGMLDIVMPDVKYCGGLRAAFRVSELCRDHGAAFAPHNPSGPIGLAATLQVCRAAPTFEVLELQVGDDEDAARRMAVVPTLVVENGQLAIPDQVGHGVVLQENAIRAMGGRVVARFL